ncbi:MULTISPECIES: autotransporter domain-containing protein [unclassified Anaerobiospirillum]|uniref:autotransporter domain-containing protein n=1 Tax=unclassified Anaerobiospirillum TaxID=2647410 RepID=UPI001FF5454A|nr:MULTISPECIES: autotransporter domain-containing protein [unclassified Anaerobiospirillum]MCK0535367.1 autotransporter domain-containing protein [Anaerobiospirillum sp. NML120511]MCK0540343.1 autotransporter domain-containing protein [Anaerobiospirillum sp. NML02-A-032]
MKQTNNAIKFLMAQYRAIFKSAYIKGIATATILTTALAVGQAQAAPPDLATLNKDTTIDKAADQLNVSGDVSNTNTFTLTIASGDNVIKGPAAQASKPVSVSLSNATFLVNGENTTLQIKTSTNEGATLSLKKLDIQNGAVTVSGNNSKEAKIVAETISMSSDKAKLTVSGDHTSTLGDATKTVYDLKNGATITIGKSGAMVGKSILSDGGKIVFAGSGSGLQAPMYLEKDTSGSAQKLDITVSGNATDSISLAGKAADNRGVLHFKSGSTIDLKADATSGGILNIASNNKFGSIVKFDKGVTLTSTGSGKGGLINVSGTAANGGTSTPQSLSEIHTDATVLTDFLSGKGGVAGAIDLKADSALKIIDDVTVDVAAGSNNVSGTTVSLNVAGVASQATAAAGKVNVSGKSEIHAKNIVVSKNMGSDLNDKLVLKASDTLTLGGSNYSGTATFGFSGAEAVNLKMEASGGTLTLADNVTLRSLTTKEVEGKTKVVAGEGKIEGNALISGGSIIVDGGKYTAGGTHTVKGGTIKVQNTGLGGTLADQSSLKLTNLTIDLGTANGAITVSGSGSTLDLSEATITATDAATAPNTNNKNFNFKANGLGSELKIKGEKFAELLSNENSGSIFTVDTGGKVTLTGEATVKSDKLLKTVGTAKTGMVFTNGTLNAVEGLTIESVSAADGLDLGQNGKIQAGTLTMNLSETDAADETKTLIVKSGAYTTLGDMSTNAKKGFVFSGANSVLNLGTYEVDTSVTDKVAYKGLSSGGTVGQAVTLSGASAMNVQYGNWNVSGELTVSGGALTVGNADTIKDKNGNVLTASMSASNLNVVDGTVSIKSGSSVKATQLTVADTKKIEVDGSLTIKGSFKAGDTGANPPTTDTYGIKLSNDSIKVNQGASLTFESGDAITKALNATESNGKITSFDVKTDAFASGGALVSQAGSTVNLSVFKEGTVITKEAISKLTTGLFGEKSSLNGTVNLGKVVFDGLAPTDKGTVSWNDAKDFGNYLPNYTNDGLLNAKLTDVNGETIYGNWGSAEDLTKTSGSIKFAENASLNNATQVGEEKYFVVGSGGALLGIDVAKVGTMTLANGGKAGAVKLDDLATLIVDGKAGNTTALKNISGGDTAKVTLNSGITEVADGVKVGYLSMNAKEPTKLTVGKNLQLTNADKESVLSGEVEVKGNVDLAGKTTFGGKTVVGGTFTAAKDVTFAGEANITKGLLSLNADGYVAGGFLTATEVDLKGATSTLYVGNDSISEGDNKRSSATGYAEIDNLNLKGGTLFVDPDYGHRTSVAAVSHFGSKVTDAKNAGTVEGKVVVGKNAALATGVDVDVLGMMDFIDRYQIGGSLTQGAGSIMYMGNVLTVKDGSRLVLDAVNKQSDVEAELGKAAADSKYSAVWSGGSEKIASDLYMSAGSIMAIDENILKDGKAVHFDKDDAAIYSEGGKVVLESSAFINSRDIVLFTDKGIGENAGVKVLGVAGKNDIEVESLNGLMHFTLKAGEVTKGQTLKLNRSRVDTAFSEASAPMRTFLISYASLTKNWEDFYQQEEAKPEAKPEEKPDSKPDAGTKAVAAAAPAAPAVVQEHLIDREAYDFEAKFDKDNNLVVQQGFNKNDFVVVTYKENDKEVKKIFKVARNEFLEKVVLDTNGRPADVAARMGVFAGSAEAALIAGTGTYEAVAGRFGMGQQGQLMSYANNGQGTALWLSPIYKDHDSDGFNADGISWGSDASLTGFALGADYTLDSGLRYGVTINAGQGDSSGQGAATGVEGDFDYFSLGAYAGFVSGPYSVVGDLSYSVVDSDVKASTEVGKLNTSFDTTNLSMGVTGQINLSVNGLDIVPHLGLRYTRLDMDSYDVMSDYGRVGSVTTSSASMFTIPAGITISKEYFSEEWSFQPSIDFNVTGSFGDDSLDGSIHWDGVGNFDVSTKTEFTDNVSYGVLVGFGAQSERLSVGAGLGYTTSSSVDEFSLTGNLRYAF